ncbi:MAG: hypothetical protein MJ147_10695 [Clostridia bacterium]|nr:hypothetical protein [Clostridia bacterium]
MKNNSLKYGIIIVTPHFNGLGIVRSLGEAGISSVCISTSPITLAEGSKYCIGAYRYKNATDLEHVIRNIVEKFGGRPAIFPTSDIAVEELNVIYNNIKDITYCPGFVNDDACEQLSKDIMSEKARHAGFVVPETVKICGTKDENAKQIKDFGLPLILKPVSGTKGSKDDIKVCTTQQELVEALEWLENDGKGYDTILCQRYVASDDEFMIEYCGCTINGKTTLAAGQLRKIREYPVNRGSTSYAVIEPQITYVDKTSVDRFFKEVGFNGIFDLEFKVVDGIPYFLEVNYRNGAPSYAFTRAGFNIPAVWFKGVEGEKIEQPTVKETHLMCEGIDFSHVLNRNISPFKWLRQFFKADVHMIINRLDPKPLLKGIRFISAYISSKLK